MLDRLLAAYVEDLYLRGESLATASAPACAMADVIRRLGADDLALPACPSRLGWRGGR